LAETLVEKEELEKKSNDPVMKENEELKEEVEGLKVELKKTEEVERQVKEVLDKFEGILKASEEENKRLRAEISNGGVVREENEALRMFVQKATVMVTEERARNQELTQLLRATNTNTNSTSNVPQPLMLSRSTADPTNDTLRSRQSAENFARGSDAGSRLEDQQINEATEDEENEEVESRRSESGRLERGSEDGEVEIRSGLVGKKRKTPTAKKVATFPNQSPVKSNVYQQKEPLKKATPAVKIADSNDFKQMQAQVQLKKNPNPKLVRGSVGVDASNEKASKVSRKLQELEDSADDLDQGYDELYESRRQGMNPTYNRATSSGYGSATNNTQLLELLEQNKQLKMMNDLLHTSQKQLLQAKQQEMDSSLSKVS